MSNNVNEKLKIVWICSLSNPEIREHICIKYSKLESIIMNSIGRSNSSQIDSAIWNTNGLAEMKNHPEVELHVVSPVRNLNRKRQDFIIDGINYHFVRDENSSLFKKVIRFLFTRFNSDFKINRRNICNIINDIHPDLVHIIGAENPQYALALLDIPSDIPTLLQLQALLVSNIDKVNGEQKKDYRYKAEIEKMLINRADYVGTKVPSFVEYINNHIKPDAKIINTKLAMAQKIDVSVPNKEYDFVHYASMLGPSKATDIAIEAFGLAYKEYPTISLDVIGGITPEFKEQLNERILKLGIQNAVKFEGKLPTHDDVIKQIRKSKYSLLPLKISIVPNTIHEAMANGIPVVTTVTPGTPDLNSKRESVLISPCDDIQDIAKNMIKLIEDKDLYEKLRMNGAITESEHENNTDIIDHWVDVYKAIINYKNNGYEIPESFFS